VRLGLHGASTGSIISGALSQGLTALGHTVEWYQAGSSYDYVLLINVSNHGPNYTYSQLPNHPKLVFVDTAEYGWMTHDDPKYAYAFSTGSLAHVEKNREEQLRLKRHLNGRSFPYFLRELQLGVNYPSCYHPIDYPMLAPLPPLANWDQFSRRLLDLTCVWGYSHPWRVYLEKKLDEHRHSDTKLRFRLTGTRLDFHDYMKLLESSVSTVSFDGYGSGSFRVTEALGRCLLFMGPLRIQQRIPLVDGVHCVSYSATGSSDKLSDTNLVEIVEATLSDRKRCFEIYLEGYNFLATNLTCKAWAQYVLDVCEQHDWKRITPLSFDPCCAREPA